MPNNSFQQQAVQRTSMDRKLCLFSWLFKKDKRSLLSVLLMPTSWGCSGGLWDTWFLPWLVWSLCSHFFASGHVMLAFSLVKSVSHLSRRGFHCFRPRPSSFTVRNNSIQWVWTAGSIRLCSVSLNSNLFYIVMIKQMKVLQPMGPLQDRAQGKADDDPSHPTMLKLWSFCSFTLKYLMSDWGPRLCFLKGR